MESSVLTCVNVWRTRTLLSGKTRSRPPAPSPPRVVLLAPWSTLADSLLSLRPRLRGRASSGEVLMAHLISRDRKAVGRLESAALLLLVVLPLRVTPLCSGRRLVPRADSEGRTGRDVGGRISSSGAVLRPWAERMATTR